MAAFALAVGCGGGGGGDVGGVSDSETLGSLTTAQAMAVCNALAQQYPKMTVTCGSDETVSVGDDAADCSGSNFDQPPSTCDETVGDAQDCLGAIYADPCALAGSGTVPASCTDLFSSACETGGSGS